MKLSKEEQHRVDTVTQALRGFQPGDWVKIINHRKSYLIPTTKELLQPVFLIRRFEIVLYGEVQTRAPAWEFSWEAAAVKGHWVLEECIVPCDPPTRKDES